MARSSESSDEKSVVKLYEFAQQCKTYAVRDRLAMLGS